MNNNKADRTNKKPTIRDVSRLSGVSTATVSRVLANDAIVTESTRQRVLDAINALKYRKNRHASNLRKSKFTKIGVVISDIQNPFFGTVVRGIEEVTEKQDYTLILANSDEDPDRESKLVRMLLEEGVAGMILAPANTDCGLYDSLIDTAIPVVIIDRRIKGCDLDCVLVDGYRGSRAAMDHLIGLGHRQIAFIGGLEYLSVMREREEGYLDAHKSSDIPLNPAYLRHGNNRQDGGSQAMNELLSLEQPPTAVLIANNLMTLGGLQAIHQFGLKIPEQISLIGFDDMDWAPSLQPPLSVIHQPAYEMGEKAAGILLERILEPALPPRKILLETKLILRASCQKVAV